MAFRFWRRMKIAPGLTLNLSKSGGSLSFGPRGAKFTIGPHGTRSTVGIPGTGLFYTTKHSKGRRRSRSAPPQHAASVVAPADRLHLGFFRRLITPEDEREFVNGCRELVGGDEDAALGCLSKSVHLADGAYMAGFLALKHDRLGRASEWLHTAAQEAKHLGECFAKYGMSATLSLPITEGVTVHVGADERGVLLGLVEVCQRQKRWQDAADCLHALRKLEPDDPVIRLSMAEVLLDAQPDDPAVCRHVVSLADGVENDSPVHAALMLYKARALRKLDLPDAARAILTKALRRKKGRSEDLLHALRYERALAYDESGKHSRAKKELEKLYADAPHYEDVAARLGLG